MILWDIKYFFFQYLAQTYWYSDSYEELILKSFRDILYGNKIIKCSNDSSNHVCGWLMLKGSP